VATFSSVTRQHVLQALAEYDARGGEEFLEVYGFGPSRGYTLVHEGRSFDARAILGVAHRFATGRLATSDEFSGDMQGAVAILRKRGFEVTEPASASRATPVRTPRAPRTPARHPVPGHAVPRPRDPGRDLPDLLDGPPGDRRLRRLRLRLRLRLRRLRPGPGPRLAGPRRPTHLR